MRVAKDARRLHSAIYRQHIEYSFEHIDQQNAESINNLENLHHIMITALKSQVVMVFIHLY